MSFSCRDGFSAIMCVLFYSRKQLCTVRRFVRPSWLFAPCMALAVNSWLRRQRHGRHPSLCSRRNQGLAALHSTERGCRQTSTKSSRQRETARGLLFGIRRRDLSIISWFFRNSSDNARKSGSKSTSNTPCSISHINRWQMKRSKSSSRSSTTWIA